MKPERSFQLAQVPEPDALGLRVAFIEELGNEHFVKVIVRGLITEDALDALQSFLDRQRVRLAKSETIPQ